MQKGFAPIIILLVLLVLGGVIGISYYWRMFAIKDQSYPPESGSVDETIIDTPQAVIIDFGKCQVGWKRIWLPQGSITFAFWGASNGICTMKYGGEIENPQWDRRLPMTCKVPQSLGKISLNKGEGGFFPNTSLIKPYCIEK